MDFRGEKEKSLVPLGFTTETISYPPLSRTCVARWTAWELIEFFPGPLRIGICAGRDRAKGKGCDEGERKRWRQSGGAFPNREKRFSSCVICASMYRSELPLCRPIWSRSRNPFSFLYTTTLEYILFCFFLSCLLSIHRGTEISGGGNRPRRAGGRSAIERNGFRNAISSCERDR